MDSVSFVVYERRRGGVCFGLLFMTTGERCPFHSKRIDLFFGVTTKRESNHSKDIGGLDSQ